MRCFLCDNNDQGLSLYNQNSFHTSYHQDNRGNIICSECSEASDEVLSEFYEDDTYDEDEE